MRYDLQNLTVKIEDQEILKKMNVGFKDNQFTGIIGPNGSGKSTLLKCLYKEIGFYSGKILLEGKDLKKCPLIEIAKHQAVVRQNEGRDIEFNVMDMVLTGREPHKKWWENDSENDKKIAIDNLRKVGLEHYHNKSFSNLSGGEKQRVLLARALTQEPQCLLLDEPTNYLDIYHQIEFFKLVKKLKITTISVIHDLNLAANYCDYLYLMNHGKVLQKGSPTEVLTPHNLKKTFGIDCSVHNIGSQLQIVYKM